MDQISTLEAEEQAALAMLREANKRKQELLAQLDEQARINAQLRREEVLARAAELKDQYVLGISYEHLRKQLVGSSARFVPVHQDIRALLVAALPAESEEMFCELVSTLASRLIGYGSNYQELKQRIGELKASAETSRYFEPELQGSVVVVSCNDRMRAAKNEQLSDVVTMWALSWGPG